MGQTWILCPPLGSRLEWGPQDAQRLRLGGEWVPGGESRCCCQKRGRGGQAERNPRVHRGGSFPDLWAWAGIDWVGLGVCGVGAERCCVWTVSSGQRQGACRAHNRVGTQTDAARGCAANGPGSAPGPASRGPCSTASPWFSRYLVFFQPLCTSLKPHRTGFSSRQSESVTTRRVTRASLAWLTGSLSRREAPGSRGPGIPRVEV